MQLRVLALDDFFSAFSVHCRPQFYRRVHVAVQEAVAASEEAHEHLPEGSLGSIWRCSSHSHTSTSTLRRLLSALLAHFLHELQQVERFVEQPGQEVVPNIINHVVVEGGLVTSCAAAAASRGICRAHLSNRQHQHCHFQVHSMSMSKSKMRLTKRKTVRVCHS